MLVTTPHALSARLAQLSQTADDSQALLFVGARVQEADVARVRQAIKVCDRVVVASVEIPNPAQVAQSLEKLGVDALYCPEPEPRRCEVVMPIPDVDATFILQTILAVLPNVVFVDGEDQSLMQCLRNLQYTFGALFVLRVG